MVRRGKKRAADSQAQGVMRRYASGVSITDISWQTRLSPKKVHEILRRSGITVSNDDKEGTNMSKTRITLADLQSTLSEVRCQLELAQEELRDQEERRYAKRLLSLNDESTLQVLREKSRVEGKDLATIANEFLGTPPQPLAPSTSRNALETDADVTDVAAAERELLEHVRNTREELE